MGKKLAIRGHLTRGKEVIELLKMMGGKNIHKHDGGSNSYSYYIFGPAILHDRLSVAEDDDFEIFTLEEFLEKYPFKVGQLKDLTDDHISCVITEMRWNERAGCVEYHAEFGDNDYGWRREYEFCPDCQIEEPKTVISGICLNSCDYADEVELNLGDYEIEVRGSRTYAVKKKPVYPTTFDECLNVLYCKSILKPIVGHKAELLLNLEKLLICRDAYWKIAGEQMRLGILWEPDWTSGKPFYCISVSGNILGKGKWYTDNKILAFPTEEMRDAFYENFKDLIESCKELL